MNIDLQKGQKEFDEIDVRKFVSLDQLYYALTIMGYDYELLYNGQEYFLSWGKEEKPDAFSLATNFQNENPLLFDTFDDLLDNFKVGEKKLREVILDFYIEDEC